jgi:asparagine synthase (glutamine-hydrolysing)
LCGISGVLYLNDSIEPISATMKKMTESMTHRGPNHTSIEVMDRIGLGFNRLSIIDLEGGNQPMSNENGSMWLVFNGEIYNYKELRSQLINKGHSFRTECDTEVIVHLYEDYGQDCVKHLRGMFSFVIWDRDNRRLFAARDHFGIKPLYYYRDKEKFVFASEIKSILAVDGVIPNVDRISFLHYLTFQYVPQPDTMFSGIRKLEPGHYLQIDADGQWTLKKYWEPVFEPEHRPIETFVEEIRAKLRESVSLHQQCDVARGSFLSGGIDSTAISALLSEKEPAKTFSVGFLGDRNENTYARSMSDAIGTEHYEETITPDQFFGDTLKAVWHMDEPLADPSAIAVYRLSSLAKKHVTVVLSGEGADELFGGYRIYQEPDSLRPLSWMPAGMKTTFNHVLRKIPFSFYGKNYLHRGFTSLERRYYGNAKVFNDEEKDEIAVIHPDLIPNWQRSYELTRSLYEQSRHMDDVSRMQLIDMNLWLPGDILKKADKMSMAHSLELRVPFLDKEVFEIARKIPASYRVTRHTTKHVFRKAMEGIVPKDVLNRPKLGFPVPLGHWLKGRFGDSVLEQMEGSGISDWIRMDSVKAMLRMHREGAGNYSRKLWTLYVFALWHSTFIEKNRVSL